MYKVIGHPQSRTMRVLWLLEELGQSYEVLPCKPHHNDIQQINPSGKIPALIVGDDAIYDSTAICTYLADKHASLTFPAGTIERAKQDSFTNFALDEMDAILWMAAKHSFIHPEEQRVPEIKQACHYEWANTMVRLEQRLGDQTWVMGDTFTIADLIIGHCAIWAKLAKFEWPQGKVADYFARVTSRPALTKAKENTAELL
ncbi:glutathione S-transferase family protein [Pseudovibrio sp. Tun.PSC04-5.I4]|uniref:glutathione S-transferase family protein n=1 Tax=Pseudovibrio sp. Tun.PSC04-5.I4 TaxID=1798213 RepID=UPI000887EB50|nr:glutathione S-transferase family protein [Pseudovibrio sp. Tun.PSC04-5.I4]SDR26850.1 glutathione S-transferase [Pseudovibrio sp. Tun.PSC04-5.I4]